VFVDCVDGVNLSTWKFELRLHRWRTDYTGKQRSDCVHACWPRARSSRPLYRRKAAPSDRSQNKHEAPRSTRSTRRRPTRIRYPPSGYSVRRAPIDAFDSLRSFGGGIVRIRRLLTGRRAPHHVRACIRSGDGVIGGGFDARSAELLAAWSSGSDRISAN